MRHDTEMHNTITWTFSINWAHYWSLKALQELLPALKLRDVDVQTCPHEMKISPIKDGQRTVELNGICRGRKFRSKAVLGKSRGNAWELLTLILYLDDCPTQLVPLRTTEQAFGTQLSF